MTLLLFADPEHHRHDPGPGMPERPSRIEACRAAISRAGFQVEEVPAEAPSRADLERVHEPGYLRGLENLCARGGGWIDPDTPAAPGSWKVATRAAGACCSAVQRVLTSNAKSFCLIRPPGHHATANRAMGFCLINNVAVAAAKALADGVERVMVLDIDVHHGNGTQEIFWTDPGVLYVSLHQWPWFPWITGDLEETGGGPGEGANVNIPLPEGSGDDVYIQALEAIVVPVARHFRPELIIVSAGFDAHEADELSSQRVSSGGYRAMASTIAALADEVCGGKLVMALEGGYNLDALAESVAGTLAVLAAGSTSGRDAAPPILPILGPIIEFHSRKWPLEPAFRQND